MENWRTTLGNEFAGLQTRWWRTHEQLSQHALLRASEARLMGALSKGGKMRGVATNVYLWETSEKPKELAPLTFVSKDNSLFFRIVEIVLS